MKYVIRTNFNPMNRMCFRVLSAKFCLSDPRFDVVILLIQPKARNGTVILIINNAILTASSSWSPKIVDFSENTEHRPCNGRATEERACQDKLEFLL